MSNSNYVKGRTFEYALKKYLERRGYFVVRCAGSHSYVDLVAFSVDETLFIQCKTEVTKKNYKEDLYKLRCVPQTINSSHLLWVKRKAVIYVFDSLGELLHTMSLSELRK